MLVLTRKRSEKIVIPQHGITITLVAMSGDRARIGIEAPVEIEVHRKEVWDQKRRKHPGETEGQGNGHSRPS